MRDVNGELESAVNVALGVKNVGNVDCLYEEAVKIVMETGSPSPSMLSTRLAVPVPFSRTSRIIDQMEQEGLIGPAIGSKAREILVDRKEWLKKHSNESRSVVKPSQSLSKQIDDKWELGNFTKLARSFEQAAASVGITLRVKDVERDGALLNFKAEIHKKLESK